MYPTQWLVRSSPAKNGACRRYAAFSMSPLFPASTSWARWRILTESPGRVRCRRPQGLPTSRAKCGAKPAHGHSAGAPWATLPRAQLKATGSSHTVLSLSTRFKPENPSSGVYGCKDSRERCRSLMRCRPYSRPRKARFRQILKPDESETCSRKQRRLRSKRHPPRQRLWCRRISPTWRKACRYGSGAGGALYVF